MKKYLKFLVVAYIAAAFFEFIANTIGDGKLLQNPAWPIIFLIWYGIIYSILFLFRNKSLRTGVIFFALFGTIIEIVIFKRSNLVVDPIIYGLMAYVPLKFWRRSHQ